MSINDRKIAFIGGGHISEIILTNLKRSREPLLGQIMVSDPVGTRLEKLSTNFPIKTTSDNQAAVRWADVVFINVLPQVVDEVIAELGEPRLWNKKMLVSIAAGVPIAKYARISEFLPVVRTLANPPSRIGMGVVALAFNPLVTATQKEEIKAFFSAMGDLVELDERLINAVTALGTTAPVYMFIEALIDAGVRTGIRRDAASRIVYQTLAGALEVWNQSGESPAELMNHATTPGGISAECLYWLEKNGMRAAIHEAVAEGTRRAADLGGGSD